jgi:hypothetical protein
MKKLNKNPKEIPLAGFCIIRPDILNKGISIQVGNRLKIDNNDALAYRWLKDDEGFQVLALGAWRDAESIDFEFLSDEKEIVEKAFKNYQYLDAMEEIQDWSAAYLKQFLRSLGYTKPYIKDIMIQMVQDLARIHRWKITLENSNPFLAK